MYKIKNIALFAIMTSGLWFNSPAYSLSGTALVEGAEYIVKEVKEEASALGYIVKGTKNAKNASKILGRVEGALPESKIDELVEITQKVNYKAATEILGEMNLTDLVRADTFLRMAVKQEKLTVKEAEELVHNLNGVKGFSSTLSKISGNSENKLKGHLHELRLANATKKQGFEIVEIGQSFKDGIKSGTTDIDVIFQKGERFFVAEVKNYDSTIKSDTVLGDAETLLKYVSENENFTPVFFFTKEPPALVIKLLEIKGIKMFVGNAEEQAIQFKAFTGL
jgi:hypothetical protein